MLHDRHYMREEERSGPAGWLIVIVTLVVCYLIQAFTVFYGGYPVDHYLGLSLAGLKSLRLWQPLTYQLLHSLSGGIPMHLILNCLMIYMFGRETEDIYGRKTFLLLQVGGGLAGAVGQLLSVLLPHHMDAPTVGASAGVFALMAAFACLFPERQMTYIIYFFPISFRAKWLLYVSGFIAVIGTLFPFDSGTAHGAHLGGLVFGIAAVKLGWVGDFETANWLDWIQSKWPSRRKPEAPGIPAWQVEIIAKQKPSPETEFMAREVDPILEKISTHGIQSLTAKERQILEAARKRMGQR